VLLTYGPRNPGTYFYYAKPSAAWVRLADRIEGVTAEQLLPSRSIVADSSDGTRVEGFLTLPGPQSGPGPYPLLVIPHGGPIGVSDGASFDPLAQYMALSGIAVLQVNYRGSAGYGKRFLEAGLREWGRGIEDDIDAVARAAIATESVDDARVCIAGGSYGGYSALISAIRYPDRYRCAATINGVTDIPLMFQGSDWSMSAHGRRVMAERVGDPEQEFQSQFDVSPVYRVSELHVPVFIAHGKRDERVDPEHAYRLRSMLEAHGKPFEWMVVEGGRHAPTPHEWVRYADALRKFVLRHIGDPPDDARRVH
jgi:dipeptidyl aminopeptidase/acylaminoacyl peptidase